ncbi:MAG TPA: glycosyltransferase family 4 protein [Candidatus Paceibacterota bacterium]|nr:glycosyltransferase family 4 protein [Candidatus Paceibacterota bacterium]
MKIVLAAPLYPPDIGGPAKYAKALFEELAKRGLKPRLAVWGRRERALPWGLRHAWYFFRLLPKAAGADAVLALDTWSVGFPALCAAKLLRRKIAVRVGGDVLWEGYVERTRQLVRLSDFYENPRNFTLKERVIYGAARLLVRHADVLLFNTQWQMDIWRKAYGIPEGRARVLENEYLAERDFGPEPAGKKVFVAAGRGIVYKNIPAFAAAFAEVAKRHPDIELDMAPLPPEAHLKRVRSSYAYAVPSVSEVNSNNIIEALAFGKPFLAPRDSGMAGKLRGLGAFADTLDRADMERAIEELLDAAKYKEYAERIRAFSYEHTWAQITDELLEAIRTR